MSRLNNVTGWLLMALVALSPVFFGGNSPLFWTLSGTMIGFFGMVYLIWGWRTGEQLRVSIKDLALVAGLWSVVCLWLLIQSLPLGAVLGPFEFVSASGAKLYSETLSLASGTTLLMLIRWLSFGFLLLLAAQAGANETRGQRLLAVIFWIIVAHAALGLIQLTQWGDTMLGLKKSGYLGSATGTFVNRNSYATFLAVGLAVGASLVAKPFLVERSRNTRASDAIFSSLLLLAGMGLILFAILATQSRMGLFAGMAGTLAVALLALRWLKHAAILIPATIVLAVVVGLGAVWIFGQGVLSRSIDLTNSSEGRGEIYDLVWAMIKARPWLGYGGGAFDAGFPLFFGPPLRLEGWIDRAHSTYLALFSELGLVMGLVPVLLVGALFARSIGRFLRAVSIARLAAIGAIIVVAIHSTVDFSLEMEANAYLLTVLLGLGFAPGVGVRRKSPV